MHTRVCTIRTTAAGKHQTCVPVTACGCRPMQAQKRDRDREATGWGRRLRLERERERQRGGGRGGRGDWWWAEGLTERAIERVSTCGCTCARQRERERGQNTILGLDLAYVVCIHICTTVEDRGTKRERNARYAPGIASIFERDLSLLW